MSKFTYNERFTNVTKYDNLSNSYTGIKIASKLNQKNGEDYKLIDSTDIDWQGAWLAASGSYINDTYELLDAIDNIADLAELTWVKNKVNELDENVTNIISILPSYVTKDELEDILGYQQKSLIPGSYITINENNVISAYGLLSIEDAENIYTPIEDFDELSTDLFINYARRDETKYIAYSYIQNYVIRGADSRYNDLNKISSWILSQSKYEKIDYSDIDLTSGDEYFIYDNESGKYIKVDEEYIINHPDEEYYIEHQLVDDLTALNVRVNRLDETVGYISINNDGEYTYTGILADVKQLYENDEELSDAVGDLRFYFNTVDTRATLAYNTSVTAYDMAAYAYIKALSSDNLAYEAYILAYDAHVIIGHDGEDEYYRELTKEELEQLIEDPYSITVYSKHENSSGVEYYKEEWNFDKDIYDADNSYYYIKVDKVESTGIYVKFDEINDTIDYVENIAETSLYRLGSQTVGTTYAYINFDPKKYDEETGSYRDIVLNVTEGDISYDTGEILREGFITTYSLYNSFAYYSRFEVLLGESDLNNDDNILDG